MSPYFLLHVYFLEGLTSQNISEDFTLKSDDMMKKEDRILNLYLLAHWKDLEAFFVWNYFHIKRDFLFTDWHVFSHVDFLQLLYKINSLSILLLKSTSFCFDRQLNMKLLKTTVNQIIYYFNLLTTKVFRFQYIWYVWLHLRCFISINVL